MEKYLVSLLWKHSASKEPLYYEVSANSEKDASVMALFQYRNEFMVTYNLGLDEFTVDVVSM